MISSGFVVDVLVMVVGFVCGGLGVWFILIVVIVMVMVMKMMVLMCVRSLLFMGVSCGICGCCLVDSWWIV